MEFHLDELQTKLCKVPQNYSPLDSHEKNTHKRVTVHNTYARGDDKLGEGEGETLITVNEIVYCHF